MFMLEQRIQQQFFESADLMSQTADALSRPVAQAAQALLGCITAGGKLLFLGAGRAAALATYGASLFVQRFERERPPLAALPIGRDSDDATPEVQALGAPGDVLVLINAGNADEALVRAAQAKDMIVVALTGPDASGLEVMVAETDVLIAVPHERAARVLETQLLVLHCLADAVDLQLMGEQESQ